MNDGSKHPDSNRDRDLARYIGDLLERGALDDRAPNAGALSDDEAILLRAALQLRDREVAEPSEEASARMWNHVDEATRRSHGDRPPERAVIRSLRPRPWMAVAAAVLIGAVATLLILQSPDATLVAAAEAEIFDYTASDGSLVRLRPHSELYLVSSSSEEVRYRLEGEAFFDVTERDGAVFAVEASDALVEVLGTRFNLSTWGEAASVYLEEGRIRFAYQRTGANVILEPGEWSRITGAGVPLPPSEEPAEEHVDWLDGEIRFDQRRTAQVAAEIEQHFDIELELPERVAAETLTGRILLDNERQSLEDFGRALGGRFTETAAGTYRFESE